MPTTSAAGACRSPQLAELYRAVRLYVNFFQPSMKLVTKTRTGSRVRRTYGPAQTPFQRVLASGVLDASHQQRLNAVYRALDPVRLLHQLETLQEALWRQAIAVTGTQMPPILTGLFIQSLNQMIDSQGVRLAALRNRIPTVVLLVLYALASAAGGFVGYS